MKLEAIAPNHSVHKALLALSLAALTGYSVVNERTVEHRIVPGWSPGAGYKIAVLPFKASSPGSVPNGAVGGGATVTVANGGEAVADQMSSALMGVPGLQVIERTQLKRILEEHNLALADLAEATDLHKLKGMLLVQGLVLGTVTEYCNWQGGVNWGATVSFNGRLVDVETGQVLMTFTCTSKKHNGVLAAMTSGLASETSRKISTELERRK